jgi:hypothetical protein
MIHVEAAFKHPGQSEHEQPIEDAVRSLAKQRLAPFHWELEFPEVFMTVGNEAGAGGFHCIVGNPPFLGGTLIGGQLGLAYHDYLIENYPPATGLADLISFFLRRLFELIRPGATCGVIATNTVAQGDTRSAGLTWVLQHGGSIYQAQRRYQWPGEAAVVVSLLHIQKSARVTGALLNGSPVDRISAYLLQGQTDTTPRVLAENKGTCFRGTKIWGSGFVFEEAPSNGSSSLTELEALMAREPRNREVIFAYLGGEDFNASPTQSPSRFVIDFGSKSEESARQWPALFSIVEERVRPVRLSNKQRNYRDNWWLHANRVEEAGPYLEQNGRLLALTCVSQHLALAFVERGTIIQDRMMLLLLHENADFAMLQSRVHEVWVRMVGTTLGDAMSYTTMCFETFPRPTAGNRSKIEAAGGMYYEFRASLMKSNAQGLTKTYNRFHDPFESDLAIHKLRELHGALDRAVLDAYGWSDIPTNCEFILEYDIDEQDWGDKKKPYRYRWPEDVRDEVLTRLLELNLQKAEQETIVGVTTSADRPRKNVRKTSRTAAVRQPTLYGVEDVSE